MKYDLTPGVSIASILVFLSCLLSCGDSNQMSELVDERRNGEEEPKDPAPNDYWYRLRSHPEKGYDQRLYLEAMNRINAIKLSKAGMSSGDLDQNWTLEGPSNIGGRVNVLTEQSPGSDTIYAGAANGGVFRTLNGGATWDPIFDFHANMAIGAIELDGQNIYVGTGDRNFGGGSYAGNGLYFSNDFGSTWSNLGLNVVGAITDVSLDPANASTIVVGALGNLYAKSSDRGIFRTDDGGATWTNTLFVNDSSGVCDLVRDPNNAQIMYCATFNRVNLPDRAVAKGPDSKIFKSTDGGASWTQLTGGLPSVNNSRVGISIAKTNSNLLFAIYVDEEYNIYEVYKTFDAGNTWSSININSGTNGMGTGVLGGFGWYFGTIYINPFNENHIVIPGVDMWQSVDGGANWAMNVPDWWTYDVHADKHDVEFPDANSMLIATDGGIYETNDLGANWSDVDDIPITQFYDITIEDLPTGLYSGGTQDNGTTSGNASSMAFWTRDFGGDGFEMTYIPATDDYIYEVQRGNIYYVNFGIGTYELLDFGDPDENFDWFTPYEFDKNNFDMVVGSNRLLYMLNPPFSSDQVISGDLTRTAIGATDSSNHTIVELERNRLDSDHLLVGTSGGLVWKGDIFGGIGNWENITGSWPERTITSVNHSTIDPDTYFVAMTGYYRPYDQAEIYKTTDGGLTWTNISGDMPAIGVNDLLIPENGVDQVIFAATDGGVFLTTNGGSNWEMIGTNLPTITVAEVDIDLANDKLLAGTFARSLWSYDISFLNLGQPPTSVTDEESIVKIYPNPASEYVMVDGLSGNSEIVIRTIHGALIERHKPNGSAIRVDCYNWANGMYVFEVDGQTFPLMKR